MATADLDRPSLSKVDLAEAPSRDWGWTADFTIAKRVAWFAVIVSLLAMIKGNHKGHVEDLYLIFFTGLIIIGLAYGVVSRRGKWKN